MIIVILIVTRTKDFTKNSNQYKVFIYHILFYFVLVAEPLQTSFFLYK